MALAPRSNVPTPQRHPVNNPGAFAMPAGGDIVESPEPQGDENTPMLGATGGTPTKAEPMPPSYQEKPEPGTASGMHTPSEAGSPVHEATSPMDPLVVNGLPVTIAGLRPLSMPPSYEDVLREDRRHPGPTGLLGMGHGVLGDDDHFDARMSDSD